VDNPNIEAHNKGGSHVTKVTTKGKFSFDFPDFKILFQGNKDKEKAGANESVTDEHASSNHDAFASHFTSPSSPMPSTSKPSPSLSAFTNDAYGGGGSTASSSAISTEDIEAKSAAAFLLYQSSKSAKNDVFSPLTNKLSTIGVAAAAVALSAAGLELGEAGLTGGWLEEFTAMATVAAEGSGGGALGFILGPMAVFTAVPSAIAVKLWRSNTDKAYKKEKDAIMNAKILEKNRINEEKKKVEEEREKALQSQIKEKEIERLTKEVKELEDKEILQKQNKIKAENEIIAEKKLREERQISKDNEERNTRELSQPVE
jgi:membrane-associated HD superfamily phosphohydrolase